MKNHINWGPSLLALLFIIFFSIHLLPAQHLAGIIIDEEGQPIFAANIYCKTQAEKGTISDLNGRFKLEPEMENCDSLVVSYLGYEIKYLGIPLAGEPIVLQKEATAFAELEIKASPNVTESFAIMKMDKLDIYLNPSASADPLKAISILPYSTNDDETANPALRGSDPGRTRVYLNGAPIERPVKNSQLNGVGFFSLFNTALLEKQVVYPSNPPLNFGNSSAGIVELETDTYSENNSFQFSAGLANTGLNLTRRIQNKGIIQIYGNWNLSKPFLSLNQKALPFLKSFYAKDVGLNFAFEWKEKNKIRFFSYGLDEGAEINLNILASLDSSRTKASRNFNILNYKRTLNKGWLSLVMAYDWRRSTFEYANIQSKEREKQYYGAINWKHFFNDNWILQLGASTQQQLFVADLHRPLYYYNIASDAPYQEEFYDLKLQSPELYGYLSIALVKALTMGLGYRQGLSSSSSAGFNSWQANFKYEKNQEHRLLLAGGLYHSFAQANFFSPNYELLKSRQLAVEYQFERDNTLLQGALFFKEEEEAAFPDRRIFGLELYWEQVWGKYLKTTLANTFLDVQYTSEGINYQAQNDFPYFTKLSFNYNNNKFINIGVSAILRPGQRYTGIIGSEWRPFAQAYEPIFATQFFNQRHASYQSVNIQLSKSLDWKQYNCIAFLNINNLLDRANPSDFIYNQDYSQAETTFFAGRIFYAGVVFGFNQ